MKGKYKCRHPEKYKGNPSNIIFRSSWEMVVMSRLDKDPDVEWWQSEEFAIPYISPVDKRWHRYFVDFAYKKNGKITLIEVKPKKQTLPPKKVSKVTKSVINEAVTYVVNEAKWAAAKEYCLDKGYKFVIMTEDEIFGKFAVKL